MSWKTNDSNRRNNIQLFSKWPRIDWNIQRNVQSIWKITDLQVFFVNNKCRVRIEFRIDKMHKNCSCCQRLWFSSFFLRRTATDRIFNNRRGWQQYIFILSAVNCSWFAFLFLSSAFTVWCYCSMIEHGISSWEFIREHVAKLSALFLSVDPFDFCRFFHSNVNHNNTQWIISSSVHWSRHLSAKVTEKKVSLPCWPTSKSILSPFMCVRKGLFFCFFLLLRSFVWSKTRDKL